MTDYDPQQRTRTLARIVGPYLIVMGGMLAVRAPQMALMLPAFMQDGPLLLATGAFGLMAGLTIIALHHHFSSPAAAVISVIGIVTALKATWLLIAPQLGAPLTAALVRASPLLVIVALAMMLVGAWLSAIGWFARSKSRP
jgi:hypothetical protein